MPTGFKINGVDIEDLFQTPITGLDTYNAETGFKYKKADGTYQDIGNRLYAANFGYNSTTNTNYRFLSSGSYFDLTGNFAPKLSNLFTYSGSYSFKKNVNYNNVNYNLVITITEPGTFKNIGLGSNPTCYCTVIGGGGGGGASRGYEGAGGGGAGQFNNNDGIGAQNSFTATMNISYLCTIGTGGSGGIVYDTPTKTITNPVSGGVSSISHSDGTVIFRAEGGGAGGMDIPNNVNTQRGSSGTNSVSETGSVTQTGSSGGASGYGGSKYAAEIVGRGVKKGGIGVGDKGGGGGGGGSGEAGGNGNNKDTNKASGGTGGNGSTALDNNVYCYGGNGGGGGTNTYYIQYFIDSVFEGLRGTNDNNSGGGRGGGGYGGCNSGYGPNGVAVESSSGGSTYIYGSGGGGGGGYFNSTDNYPYNYGGNGGQGVIVLAFKV